MESRQTDLKQSSNSSQVYDVDGSLWDIRKARATKHGFDIFFGYPAARPFSQRRCMRYIVTPPLVAYWQAHRTEEGATYDLPLSRTMTQRIRRRLGFN